MVDLVKRPSKLRGNRLLNNTPPDDRDHHFLQSGQLRPYRIFQCLSSHARPFPHEIQDLFRRISPHPPNRDAEPPLPFPPNAPCFPCDPGAAIVVGRSARYGSVHCLQKWPRFPHSRHAVPLSPEPFGRLAGALRNLFMEPRMAVTEAHAAFRDFAGRLS